MMRLSEAPSQVISPMIRTYDNLMFADDLLLVAKANKRNAAEIWETIVDYHNQSGQQINILKSQI